MHEPSLFPAADDACVTQDTQMMRDVDHRNGQSLGEFGDTAFSSLQFTDNPQPFRCCKSGEHAGTTGGLQWIGSHGSCQTFNQTLVNQMRTIVSARFLFRRQYDFGCRLVGLLGHADTGRCGPNAGHGPAQPVAARGVEGGPS